MVGESERGKDCMGKVHLKFLGAMHHSTPRTCSPFGSRWLVCGSAYYGWSCKLNIRIALALRGKFYVYFTV